MMKLTNQDRKIAGAAAMLILLAVICRILGLNGFYCKPFGILRSCIYIFLYAAWGVSLQRRTMQPQQRHYMVAIAVCMSFWFLVRTLKYFFIPADTMPDLLRLAWYAYYIPMLMIPVLSLLTALSIGKPEHYRTPPLLYLLWLPTALLILIVLTNDLHQTVFAFEEGMAWTDDNSTYGYVYWIVLAWILSTAAVAFGIILRKCRIPSSRKILWLPLIPFLLIFTYGILYITALSAIKLFVGDMTAVFCLLIALTFESSLQCGLIQSNSHYAELFRASSIAAQITDADFNVCVSAENAKPVEKQVLAHAERGAIILDGGMRLCAEPIRGGFVFWQEDISTLLALLEELSGTREELKSYGGLLEEENKQKRRRKKLEEQKRLFEMVQETIRPHLAQLNEVLEQLRHAETEKDTQKALGKLAVIGAYLKRRSNLIMLADNMGQIPVEELRLCLKESETNLRLCGVSCALKFSMEGELPFETVGALFDFYETAVELALDTLTGLTAFAAGTELRLMLSCDDDLTALCATFENAYVTREDGVWYCALCFGEGGRHDGAV